MSEINMQYTTRDFWATRPRRRADDRKIAGVAAAIARRYAVDPVLVRVAFVVATISSGGAGVLLYLLGWLLLPVQGDQSSGVESMVGRGRSSMSTVLTIVLLLLLIPTAAAVLGGQGSGIIGLAVGLGALLLLHRSRAALGEIPGSPPAAHTTPDTVQATTEPATPDAPGATTGDDPEKPVPPAWDPLGAAPFAWDLPEPSAPTAPVTPPQAARSKITPITLGLALLTGGIALAFGPALSAARIAAMLLGVVGLGLVVGSFLRGGRGLVPLAIPLALLTWALSAAPTSDFQVGTRHWNATTAADLREQYSVSLGNGSLDLTRLQLANGERKKTSVAVGVGETHVWLPPNLNVEVNCRTQVGDVACLGKTDSNGNPSEVAVTSPGTDSRGGTLVLDAHTGVGQIHVDRAR